MEKAAGGQRGGGEGAGTRSPPTSHPHQPDARLPPKAKREIHSRRDGKVWTHAADIVSRQRSPAASEALWGTHSHHHAVEIRVKMWDTRSSAGESFLLGSPSCPQPLSLRKKKKKNPKHRKLDQSQKKNQPSLFTHKCPR